VIIDPKIYGAKDAFFGYYDRSPVDENGNILSILVFSDRACLCVFSREGAIIWQEVLHTFNYQQGCLATWIGDEKFVFNTIVDGVLKAVLIDLKNNSRLILFDSFQSFGGRYFSSVNILRINKNRPEYGYSCCGARDYEDSLLRISDLKQQKLIWDLSEHELSGVCGLEMFDEIKVNHVIFSPSGDQFLFMVRWFVNGIKSSALLCGDINSQSTTLLVDSGIVSHYCWLDDEHYVFWGRGLDGKEGYYLGNIDSGSIRLLDVSSLSRGDGHPSRINRELFVSDTYPDKSGSITLYTKSVSGCERILVSLKVPFFPRGPKRTDFHPRYVAAEEMVYFDSNHLGRRCLCRVKIDSALV
jgi:hypothetical protein